MYTLVLKHCSWMGTPGTYVYVGTYHVVFLGGRNAYADAVL